MTTKKMTKQQEHKLLLAQAQAANLTNDKVMKWLKSMNEVLRALALERRIHCLTFLRTTKKSLIVGSLYYLAEGNVNFTYYSASFSRRLPMHIGTLEDAAKWWKVMGEVEELVARFVAECKYKAAPLKREDLF